MFTFVEMEQCRKSAPDAVPPSLLEQAITALASAIFITDRRGQIVWVNDAFSRLSGYSARDIVGCQPTILKSGKQDPQFYTELWQAILAGRIWQGEVVDQGKSGALYTADEIITPLINGDGVVTHFVAIQHDITQRKHDCERERHLAYHDLLTGLPNRADFLNKLQQAIPEARRKQHMLAVLFLDLDKFKPVNDIYGHTVGDQVLVAVAGRLQAAVRRSDIVARFGGDEFAILLSDLAEKKIATNLAHKLVDLLSSPFMLANQTILISASIGIALYPDDGALPETLMSNTDVAMYRAKNRGGNDYQFFQPLP
jgi:diguanylate cyclase (GGDEF)-like protein/PAS domain S-box-containing protein